MIRKLKTGEYRTAPRLSDSGNEGLLVLRL